MKILVWLLVGLGSVYAHASDLVAFPKNNPVTVDTLTAPIRIVNIWATWCAPCRKEMPEMSAWYKKQNQKKIALIGIALDRDENITKFLKTTPVSYPIWRYTGKDSRAFMKGLGNQAGVLPYTVIEKKACSFKHSITGEVNAAKLNEAVKLINTKCG